MTVVPTLEKQELLHVQDEYNIQYIEVEYPRYNGESKCNVCHKTIYWNKGVIHKRTKRLVPLEEPYVPDSGILAKRHLCMKQGTGKWINKYEDEKSNGDAGRFWRDNVIQERDNKFLKQLKLDGQRKLQGYGYTNSLKRKENIKPQWCKNSFEY